ncbi:uncharacterized protein [Diadema setosum]|uniref:uncharacterized protein n=1 Tax=Diadema setosum TaxID=31175 RepID=UPI003B3B836D
MRCSPWTSIGLIVSHTWKWICCFMTLWYPSFIETDGAVITLSPAPSYQPKVTPQSTGREGTQEYIAGFLVCLTLNIVFVSVVLFALCYLKKISQHGGDEIDGAQPRQKKSWKEALEPLADKVFLKS